MNIYNAIKTRLAVKPSKFDHDKINIYTVLQRNITVATLLFEAGWQHWGFTPFVHTGGASECRFDLTGGASAARIGEAGMGAAGMGAAEMGAGGGMGAAGGRPTVTGRSSQNSPRSGYCGWA